MEFQIHHWSQVSAPRELSGIASVMFPGSKAGFGVYVGGSCPHSPTYQHVSYEPDEGAVKMSLQFHFVDVDKGKVITVQQMLPVPLTFLVVPSWHCSASLCGKAITLFIFCPAELLLFETVKFCCIFYIFVFKSVLNGFLKHHEESSRCHNEQNTLIFHHFPFALESESGLLLACGRQTWKEQG